MSRWPDFFIVGAARSGTTSLYYHLKGHPNIFMPSVKEPHFFNGLTYGTSAARRRALPNNAVREEEDYLKLFKGAQSTQIIGEASAGYLPDTNAPRRIKERNPEARVIAVLRDPVDRAYSHYLLSRHEGREWKPSFYEALEEDYEHMVRFPEAGSFYIWPGLYHQHIKRYLEAFGAEQVRIYLYEDLVSDITALVKDLCTFLQVPFYNGSFFDPGHRYYTYGMPRNTVFKWVSQSMTIRSLATAVAPMHLLIPLRDRLLVNRNQAKPSLDPRAQEFLRSIYHDDTVKLQELINKDLRAWLNQQDTL